MASPLPPALARLAVGLLLVGAAPLASPAMLVYTATGGGISGSLGGQAFTAANWTLTATADEGLATFSSFTVPFQGTFQLWWLPVAPKLTIETPTTPLIADLLPDASLHWLALSGSFPVGPTPKIGFVFTTATFNPETAAGVVNVPGSFVNLQSPVSFAGASLFEPYTSFPSSAGPLVISSGLPVPGTFRIDPVPGPLPALAVAGAFSWSRRLRRRLDGRPA